ncbi:MAG: hypothetical protein IT230_13305 [Flavobacteriales bacterium]|nr:hypothetical protein [Flavobacteriales bacterium]
MIKQILLSLLPTALFVWDLNAQNKREIIPRDSITDKYCYQAVSDSLPFMKEELRIKLEKWIKQNYNALENKYVKLGVDGDTYTMHDREALPGRARKFVEYDLTVDLKENRYRYKLTNLQYAAVGMYPLEDKMATDKRSDFEEMDVILRGIIASMEAALKSTW